MSTATNPNSIESAHDILHHTTRRPLSPIFSPQSIAVIGATETLNSVGRTILENLTKGGFEGPIYPVNPKRETVLGIKAYPSITAVPAAPDLAVIITPPATVPGIVKDCGVRGVKGVIIISAGFKEIGAPGVELERQVLEEANKAGIRIVGPNCLGVMVPSAKLNATFAADMARPGSVGFISQSGALCTAILDWSLKENVGFSAFVSLGSMLDVSWGDLIQHLGDDPNTKSIVMYMETIGDARAFLSAAREVALTKPIIVIKPGRTEAAAKAAASHTGSLTGSDEVLQAAFQRVGVLRVEAISELFDMAEVLAKQPRPKGPRLTIVTNAGGPGVLATDMLIGSGAQLADLAPETMAALNQILPPTWSHNNPVDIIGDAKPELYAKSLEIAAKDPNTDGMLVILTPQAMTDPTATAECLKPYAHIPNKPVIASWMGADMVAKGEDILNAAKIPTFKYPDRAAKSFYYMWRYSENLRQLYETPAMATDDAHGEIDREKASAIIAEVRKSGRTILTEFESKKLLAAYGIPTVETHIALTENDAVKQAARLGFPVVLKLYSETITHKTDVGGVQLNLRTASAVRQAWKTIETSCDKEGRQGTFPRRHRAAHDQAGRLRNHRGQQHGPAVRPGAAVRHGRPARGSVQGPRARPAAAQRHARAPHDGTHQNLTPRSRACAGAKPPTSPRSNNCWCASASSSSSSRGFRNWTSIRCSSPPNASSRSTPAWCCTTRRRRKTSCPIRPSAPIRIQYASPWKMKNKAAVIIRPIKPEDEPLMRQVP